MIETIQYLDIVETIKADEKRVTGRVYCFDSVDSATRNLMAEMNAKLKRHTLVGVLFCNPNTQFCKDEILNSLNYFHKRSKHFIHIFCCGFGAYEKSTEFNDIQQVIDIDGTPWFYSDTALVNVVESVEAKISWTYSGENELLILDVTPCDDASEVTISNAIVCNLEQMKTDKAFTSVRSLIENLIRYAASDECADTWEFSDKQGLNAAKDSLKDGFLGLLPKPVSALYKNLEGYAVRKI
ncbi:MAG: hypothetical protein GY710_05725 [Desulfobacteraceae bacterium]|nr:hypothetical protein [Desulfobacteraceae bacterium]